MKDHTGASERIVSHLASRFAVGELGRQPLGGLRWVGSVGSCRRLFEFPS